MTQGFQEDVQFTRFMVTLRDLEKKNQTWLRHSKKKQAGLIDELILDGNFSLEEIALKVQKSSPKEKQSLQKVVNRVNFHIRHLGDEYSGGKIPHHLKVVSQKGKLCFSVKENSKTEKMSDAESCDDLVSELAESSGLMEKIMKVDHLILKHADASARSSNIALIKDAVGNQGGVYVYHNASDERCLYVGKAKTLASRLKCHYDESVFVPHDGKVGLLGDKKTGMYPAFFRDKHPGDVLVRYLFLEDENNRLITERILTKLLAPEFLSFQKEFNKRTSEA